MPRKVSRMAKPGKNEVGVQMSPFLRQSLKKEGTSISAFHQQLQSRFDIITPGKRVVLLLEDGRKIR